MKYIYKIVLLSFLIIGITSCDKNENFEILAPQGGITINSPIDGSTVVINKTNPANPGLTISWTSANLEGTGVTYTVEVALIGTDFAVPFVIGTTEATSINFTVEELNTLALDILEIPGDTEAGIDIRVSADDEVSQKISVLLTPFSIEYAELYLIGSLTAWDPAQGLPFTRLGFNEFEITVDLADGDAFKFIPQTDKGWDGAWKEDPNNPGTLIDEPGDPNISGYPAGKYKIYVNLNTLTFTIEEAIADKLYIIGSLTGWAPETAFPMNNVSDGIFSLAIELVDGDAFKFIPTNTSWDGAWKEDPNNSGSLIDETGDPNISGYPAGKYVAIVDLNTLTFKLTPIDNFYIVGSLTSWDPTSAIPMSEASLGVFSKMVDLADGDAFKFIPTNLSWDGAWKEDPANPGTITDEAGDPNISGFAAGKYVISVNFNTLSFTVSLVSAIPTNLYLVGQFNGWDAAGALAFTEVDPGVFQITQALTAGGEGFKFLPQQDWPNDWGESKTSPRVLEQGNEQNVTVAVDEIYLITVDFNKGTISVIPD